MAALDKFRTGRSRRNRLKIIVLNNAFRRLDHGMQHRQTRRVRYLGRGACLAHAWNRGQDVTMARYRSDGIIEGVGARGRWRSRPGHSTPLMPRLPSSAAGYPDSARCAQRPRRRYLGAAWAGMAGQFLRGPPAGS